MAARIQGVHIIATVALVGEGVLTEAEQRIEGVKARYLSEAAKLWRGREAEFAVLLLRALDDAAFAFTMAPNRGELVRRDRVRHHVMMGAATALRPLLPRLAEGGDFSMPSYGHDEPSHAHIRLCGRFSEVARAAALERYGLADVTVVAGDRIVINVASDADEVFERAMGRAFSRDAQAGVARHERKLSGRKRYAAGRLDEYVEGWGQIDPAYWADQELLAYHHEFGRTLAIANAERQALPPDAMLGGRRFADWANASLSAYGDVLHQVAIATRMRATELAPDPGDFLTRLVSRRDLRDLWIGRGQSGDQADATIACLTLDDDTLAHCERVHEVPLPYYLPVGADHLLAPAFGGLMNSTAGMLWRLRREHTRDWDRCVDDREPIFRSDLRALFREPRYHVPAKPVRLTKSDGNDNTDIDAVVLDRSTGALVLVQLKWPDIYGRSLAERDSRRRNILKANDWVERTSAWVSGRSSAEVGAAIGLDGGGRRPPELLVLSRHTIRFTDEVTYDTRARWVSWPTLHTAVAQTGRAGILAALRQASVPAPPRLRPRTVTEHPLPGLLVEIRT